MRFGTIPLVANTGGLADTVIHANTAAIQKNVATGVVMTRIDSMALTEALDTLKEIYSQKIIWKKLQKNAMSQIVDWTHSANTYYKIYSQLLNTYS